MALKLIRRGARLHPVEVKPGTGWVNVTKAGDTNPYFGPGVFTVQASNCDGVRLFDFAAKGTPHVESQAGNWKQVSAIATGMAVVRVLNPTENTEVTIMSEPLPPPCSIAGLLRRWVGGCRGADVDRFTRWCGAHRKFRPGRLAANLPHLGHHAGARNLGKQPCDGDPTAGVVQVPPVDKREPDRLPERGGATGRLRSPSECGHERPGYRHGVPRHGRCERALQGGQTRGIPHGVVPAVAQGVGC